MFYNLLTRSLLPAALGNGTRVNAIRALSSSSDSVIATESSNKGVIILNRPKQLNTINLEMVRKITKYLRKWEKSKLLVIIKGTGDKSFCAGGDVRAIAEAGPTEESKAFFREEYTLNNLIANYKIPYIALMDGITMGGGVGLSVHGKYRIATERTVFAMPETGIGLFPDVGGTFFLPRLLGELGMYLALTGQRLYQEDVTHSRIATHYCPSSKLQSLETALLNCNDPDEIPDIICSLTQKPRVKFTLAVLLGRITKCFAADTVEEILKNLEKDNSGWALKTIDVLKKMSPLSLKVTHRSIKEGDNLSLKHCLIMEYRLVNRFMEDSDFKEGVRAVLIDKDQKPKWNPSRLEDVTKERVDKFFAKLPDTEELKLESNNPGSYLL